MAAYDDITADVLSVIKAPPLRLENVSYGSLGVGMNNIRNHLFQIRTRFVYDDNEKSVWSHVSNIGYIANTSYAALHNLYTAYGYENLAVSRDRVGFKLDIPDDPTLMYLDIAVRRGNYGNWLLYKTVDISGERGTNDYWLYFYNDKMTEVLDQADVVRPYDYVPRRARTQEIIGDNHLVYGGILEGYDNNVTLNLTFQEDDEAIDLYGTDIVINETRPVVEAAGNHTYRIDYGIGLGTGTYVVIISAEGVSYEFISNRLSSAITAAEALDALVDDIEDCPVVLSASRTNLIIDIQLQPWVDFATEDVVAVIHTDIDVRKSLKDGATHYFGIVYGDDKGRLGPVLRSEATEFYIDFCTQSALANKYYRLDYEVNHTPPEWAHTWRIVYGRSDILWFQQFLLRNHDFDDRSIWREDGYTKIKINEGLNNVRGVIQNFSIPNYNWQEGDRLRIIGTKKNDNKLDTISLVSEYCDLEVLGFDGIYIYTSDWAGIDGAPDIDTNEDDILIEIYRLRPESENPIYYGVGHVFEITNPGQDNRSHANSSGTLDIADCYATYHPMVYLLPQPAASIEGFSSTSTTSTTTWGAWPENVQSFPCGIDTAMVMSMYQSPFFSESNHYDLGEPHIVDPDFDERRLENLRWSGRFVNKTGINDLNRFEYDDDLVMEDKFGAINGLREMGDTLKVLQRSKNTSIYIGREMALDAQGNSQVVYSSKVLGSKNPQLEDWGTVHPSSITVSKRYMYYFDIYAGRMVRDDPNGQDDIGWGPRKMQTYFRDKAAALLASGVDNVNIIGGVDNENNLVFFTFLDRADPTNNETIAFNELTVDSQGVIGRWQSFYSFTPECYGRIGDDVFVSIDNGQIYLHNNDTPNRCTFYGVKYKQEIHLVSNVNAKLNKVFNSIEISSNEPWTLPNDDSIVITPDSTYPNGMQSKLRLADFEQYEGDWRAPFLRDLLSGGGSTPNDYYLYNGRELRGRELLMKLENQEDGEVNLFIVNVNSSVSR